MKVFDGLLPALALEGVMRELGDAFVQPSGVHALHGDRDPGVKRPPPALGEGRVRHLLRQRVLEGVFGFVGEPGVVEELAGLQHLEPLAEGLARARGDGGQHRVRHAPAQRGGRLQ